LIAFFAVDFLATVFFLALALAGFKVCFVFFVAIILEEQNLSKENQSIQLIFNIF
jgi:hypothetical protein